MIKTDRIFAVMGGLHLEQASESRIQKTIETFDRLHVQKIFPAHCTGHHALARFCQSLPDRILPLSVGTRYSFTMAD